MDFTRDLFVTIVVSVFSCSRAKLLGHDTTIDVIYGPLSSGSYGLTIRHSYYGSSNLGRLCSSASCFYGTVCRLVKECDTCAPQARCVHSDEVPNFPDAVCRATNFDQAVLVAERRNRLKGLTCTTSPKAVDTCPRGSTCVEGGRVSTCCYISPGGTWRPVVHKTPISKPGTCSKVMFGVCGGTICSSDANCPGQQKCCPSRCGGNICVSPTVTSRPFGCGVCAPGSVCRTVDGVIHRCIYRSSALLGLCPLPTRSYCGPSTSYNECSSDLHCARNSRCCFDGCVYRCQLPLFNNSK